MAAQNIVKAGTTTVTTAGTPVALATAQQSSWVTIQSKTTNTGAIYVGADSTVAAGANGFTLVNPGDSVVFWGDDRIGIDLSRVYVDSSVNGEGVTYLAIVP